MASQQMIPGAHDAKSMSLQALDQAAQSKLALPTLAKQGLAGLFTAPNDQSGVPPLIPVKMGDGKFLPVPTKVGPTGKLEYDGPAYRLTVYGREDGSVEVYIHEK